MSEKILITGACGFIGSHLAELCVNEGFNVVAFDRYNSNNHWGWLEDSNFNRDMEIILGDIRDYDSVNKAMEGCDNVFHLAALIGIPYSYTSPLAYIRTNIEGTYNILESSKNKNISQLIVTSTSETYGTANYTPIDENHSISSQSPYASTKVAADQLSISYHKSFELPVKIARPFNTYGPRQSSRAIIPTIINQILDNQKKIKLGNLKPTRDLTYVEDICAAFLEIYKTDKFYGEVVNIGSKNEISIQNIFKKISSILNSKIELIQDDKRIRPKKSEVNQLICDNSKILENSNWKPKINFDEGLLKTIDWLKNNRLSSKSDLYHV